jgi:Golgi apparatus protein 1
MNEQIKLDPDLVKACQSDMSRLCQNVQPGKGRMLECLRTNREKLSLDCSAKLRKRDQILLVDQNVDYTLQTNCKNAIKEYCNVNSEDTIACLRKHLLKPTLEYECRTVVINRIMVQNKDFRLNPTLWKACFSDVQKQCAHEVANINNLDVNLNGQVLKCLKKSFVRNKLSKQCQVEIDQVIREAANVDYRLDPMVAENCMPELENFCSEKESHEKENCLRLAFHKQKIKEDSKCYDVISFSPYY